MELLYKQQMMLSELQAQNMELNERIVRLTYEVSDLKDLIEASRRDASENNGVHEEYFKAIMEFLHNS